VQRDDEAGEVALHAIPTTGWPPPEPPTSFRGVPLASRDAAVRAAIAALAGELDVAAATAAWEAALAAPAWPHPPVWIHADLTPLNLLVERGRLRAVIDFGGVGLGDPAVDLIPAWSYLPAASRAALRAALVVDEATWARGRGWALSFGLIAVPYYHRTNPVLAGVGRRAIAAVLSEDAQEE
jgi:aminoglycoside phosphotransferase (APT) family kinase protein